MQFNGVVKSYSDTLRCGFIAIEGCEDLQFYLKDLPYNYITPTVGENLVFQVFTAEGKHLAKQILRSDLHIQLNWQQRLKAFIYGLWVRYLSASKVQQRLFVSAVLLFSVLFLSLLCSAGYMFYQQHQTEKAQSYMALQQQQIAQQRALHGELPEQVLSEETKRQMEGKVHGSVKPREEHITQSIDKLNGRLPVALGKFKCDGRLYCSEMRSYEEALYFHRHCRGTRLDGNGNGKPCENDPRW